MIVVCVSRTFITDFSKLEQVTFCQKLEIERMKEKGNIATLGVNLPIP